MASRDSPQLGATIIVDRPAALIDSAIGITLQGFPPRQPVKVTTVQTFPTLSRWQAHATFVSDDNGHADLAEQAPVAGTYDGISPMGLFWSAERLIGAAQAPPDGSIMCPRFVDLEASSPEGTRAELTLVLVVDDEPQILRFLRTSLTANGFTVVEAATAADALRHAAADAPDVIVLDLGLPDMDGKEVIRARREWSEIPVIVLSARAREAEKIEAFDLGADDYANKPFGIGELMARLRAALRHRLRRKGETPVFRAGELSVDITRRLVKRGEDAVHLTPKEFELLRVLVQHAGKVVTQRQILQAVWGAAHVEDAAYLRVYVGQLRRKIETDPEAPSLIETEAGVGYRPRDE